MELQLLLALKIFLGVFVSLGGLAIVFAVGILAQTNVREELKRIDKEI